MAHETWSFVEKALTGATGAVLEVDSSQPNVLAVMQEFGNKSFLKINSQRFE